MSTAVSTKRRHRKESGPAAICGGACWETAFSGGLIGRGSIFCRLARFGGGISWRLLRGEGHGGLSGPGDGGAGENAAALPCGVGDSHLIPGIQDHRQGVLRGVDGVEGVLSLQPQEVVGIAVQHSGADLSDGAADLLLVRGTASASPSEMRPLSASARR